MEEAKKLSLEDLEEVSGGQFDETTTTKVRAQKDVYPHRVMSLDSEVIWHYSAGQVIVVFPDSWTILNDMKWIWVDTPNGHGAVPADDIPGDFAKC